MDILNDIIAHKRLEVAALKAQKGLDTLEHDLQSALADGLRDTMSMSRALAVSDTGIISEFKRRSPSKGWIHEDAQVTDVAPGYAQNGASALSVLTDERFFGGSLSFISAIRDKVDVPILRKDFIIDEYQLIEARLAGADAVLLIAAALGLDECRRLADKAHALGLETLLEIHDETELDYVACDVDMIGVNNRNLGSFVVDVNNSVRLAAKLPADKVRVSESGLKDANVVSELRDSGYRGFLIGETFMRTADPVQALAAFIADIRSINRH